ncbi:alkaline phosphatase D family protein [Pseudosulfitobacter pseudonitzschiae]|uniref:alkaline phosphatase D family protein n=1 Tax=Pseudosulfitobacter pseudonitzschiae TaxID=1402135 RepID=UPI001CCDE367|nr:alkaline phosphatase D family protein [Pseudosulfitobacter pseudonitzschiae]MCA0136133.1 alkaline phosphatase D family protein [Pseudosulfitobacter pseudonitzschiae]MCD2327705.1 alkaline phosphatase D family protein [Pseudosulfitobacter pseudonitzschiae]MCD2352145.1 alkaline phosphatase D family protein [Pseudosulfitobacter pseudonitzschiae]MCI2214778.1 alkaline phosphatase D family protein [Pseudosulfitobacter pseudonitzschiae]UFE29969.1 alkaline phosphatase D family protein [Pseudosulfito
MPRITFTRRQTLLGTAALGVSMSMPSLSRAQSRPMITHGVMSGDVAHDGAVIWSRADREAKMLVEWATTESMTDARAVPALAVGTPTDYTGKMALTGLPSDQDIFYRVTMADLADGTLSEPTTGTFRTAPMGNRDISFVWSGDTAGQGWGIDEDRGGMTTYATMLNHSPDFFLHSGDTVYADGPLKEEVELADGTLWKNIVTPAKTKVAETLDEFRGQHLYNYMDKNVKALNAAVPIIAQWDDHEVTNNWYPDEVLAEDDRYTVKSMQTLSARAHRAFHEMMPTRQSLAEPMRVYRKVSYGPLLDIFVIDMRTYRGDNTANTEAEGTPFLGVDQLAWLKREMVNSTATWKVIASDMPIGMMVRDGDNMENGANGDGPVLGREKDIAAVLSFIKAAEITNTVWLTADVHYTAAHHYSPDRAVFQEFEPFWEFVSGPLHAGTFGPSDYDNTFGPEVRFAKHPEPGQANLPPSDGMQFFGKVDIAADTGVMTVRLMDSADVELWSVELEPKLA